MRLEKLELEDVHAHPHTIILDGDSRARVVTTGAGMPEIMLFGATGAVRIGLEDGGLDLLRSSADRLAACVATGARSGEVLIHASSLAYPVDLPQRMVDEWEGQGLSAAVVARRIGITHSNLSKVVNKHRRPSLMLLAKYAQAVDVALDELLFSEPVPGNRPQVGQEWVLSGRR